MGDFVEIVGGMRAAVERSMQSTKTESVPSSTRAKKPRAAMTNAEDARARRQMDEDTHAEIWRRGALLETRLIRI
jgi:hypothetical protein